VHGVAVQSAIALQLPFWQTLPAGQAWPHLPQFSGSVVVFAQVAPPDPAAPPVPAAPEVPAAPPAREQKPSAPQTRPALQTLSA
jgi:hypothetical protein